MMRESVPLLCLPFLLCLLKAPTTKGLEAGRHNFKPCTGGSGSFIDDVICDPDHLVSPEESCSIVHLLTRCGCEAGHVRMVVFLADSFTPDEDRVRRAAAAPATTTTITTTTTSATTTATIITTDTTNIGTSTDTGSKNGTSTASLLKELVVASNKLNSTITLSNTTKINNPCTAAHYSSSAAAAAGSSPSILLLVAIRDPFQLAEWHSETLDGVLTKTALEEAEQQVDVPLDPLHFTSAVVQVAHQLCQSAKPGPPMTLQHIILTGTWIAFIAIFVILLVFIGVALLRARRYAVRAASRVEARHDQKAKRESCRLYPITSPSDIQDLSVIYYKTAGNVLLATTDITAVPAQDCSSTDNLLQR